MVVQNEHKNSSPSHYFGCWGNHFVFAQFIPSINMHEHMNSSPSHYFTCWGNHFVFAQFIPSMNITIINITIHRIQCSQPLRCKMMRGGTIHTLMHVDAWNDLREDKIVPPTAKIMRGGTILILILHNNVFTFLFPKYAGIGSRQRKNHK